MKNKNKNKKSAGRLYTAIQLCLEIIEEEKISVEKSIHAQEVAQLALKKNKGLKKALSAVYDLVQSAKKGYEKIAQKRTPLVEMDDATQTVSETEIIFFQLVENIETIIFTANK